MKKISSLILEKWSGMHLTPAVKQGIFGVIAALVISVGNVICSMMRG